MRTGAVPVAEYAADRPCLPADGKPTLRVACRESTHPGKRMVNRVRLLTYSLLLRDVNGTRLETSAVTGRHSARLRYRLAPADGQLILILVPAAVSLI